MQTRERGEKKGSLTFLWDDVSDLKVRKRPRKPWERDSQMAGGLAERREKGETRTEGRRERQTQLLRNRNKNKRGLLKKVYNFIFVSRTNVDYKKRWERLRWILWKIMIPGKSWTNLFGFKCLNGVRLSDASREKVISEEWGMIGKSPAASHFFLTLGTHRCPIFWEQVMR